MLGPIEVDFVGQVLNERDAETAFVIEPRRVVSGWVRATVIGSEPSPVITHDNLERIADLTACDVDVVRRFEQLG